MKNFDVDYSFISNRSGGFTMENFIENALHEHMTKKSDLITLLFEILDRNDLITKGDIEQIAGFHFAENFRFKEKQ